MIILRVENPRKERTMAKAYWIVCYHSIKNPDALAAYAKIAAPALQAAGGRYLVRGNPAKVYEAGLDRKSTRLNSSHSQISYAVFCLKKKKKKKTNKTYTQLPDTNSYDAL